MRQYNLNDFLINSNASIKDAMKKLNIAASKILFVINDEKKFVGSLSDGDIRRSILANKALDSKVKQVCRKNSYKIGQVYNKETVIKAMKELDIVFAPILDKEERISGIFSLPESHVAVINGQLDLPVVIMAGGKGTRLEPFTNVLPKPLIPVGDKTILEYIIDEYRKYSIKEFYITINYKGNLIKAYLDALDKEYRINYIEEPEFLGTAGSLKLIDNIFGTCIVSNCDIIVKADYNDVLNFHRKSKSILTILSSIQHHVIPYGVVEFRNGGVVTQIIEKPEYSMPVNTGVYILEKEVWNYIPHNKFIHMTNLAEALIKDGKRVMTYPVNQNDYIDIGQWKEYQQAVSMPKF